MQERTVPNYALSREGSGDSIPKCRSIAVVNQKGGVGKTTTAVNLAACVAVADMPTLLVDLDPQSNATSAYGISTRESAIYRAMVLGEPVAEESFQRTEIKNLNSFKFVEKALIQEY